VPDPTDDPELHRRLVDLGLADSTAPHLPTRIAAYGVIRRAGRVLLCRVAQGYPNAGEWALPGGGVDPGEAPEAGATREVEEETGLIARVAGPAKISSFTGTWRFPGGPRTFVQLSYVYAMVIVGGVERREIDGSTDELGWFSEEELVELPIVGLVGLALRSEREQG
jgi:8-oxo-dGTP diphosphatase